MTHPGLNSPRLADMRAVLDEVALSNNERHEIELALSDIEADWESKRREAYDHALGVRDDQHDEVIGAADAFGGVIAEWYDNVRNGRCSPQEARAWLRDVRADFDVLTGQHRGIETSEDRLAAMDTMSVDTYQAERLARLSSLGASSPTLMTKIAEFRREQERRSQANGFRRSKEEIDAEQDALVRALRGTQRGRS
jgi:hypothetical protein